MFLKMDTPTNTTPETSPTQDIQLTFTPEENIPIQTTDNISESTTQEVVEPAQPADAWLAQEDALVKETEEKIPSQEKQSEPTIEIQTNKENTTVETNPLQRTEPEVKPEVQQVLETQDTAVVSAPVVEIPQTPTAFQETVNIPVTPIQEEKPIQTEILPQQPLPTENTVVQNIPQMSLQEDMKIIQNISSQTTKPVESLPTETIAQVPQEASSNTLNLDNLLQSNTSAQTTNNVQQIPPTINIMPPIQGTNGVPVSTPIVEEKKTKGTKILLFVLLFVSL